MLNSVLQREKTDHRLEMRRPLKSKASMPVRGQAQGGYSSLAEVLQPTLSPKDKSPVFYFSAHLHEQASTKQYRSVPASMLVGMGRYSKSMLDLPSSPPLDTPSPVPTPGRPIQHSFLGAAEPHTSDTGATNAAPRSNSEASDLSICATPPLFYSRPETESVWDDFDGSYYGSELPLSRSPSTHSSIAHTPPQYIGHHRDPHRRRSRFPRSFPEPHTPRSGWSVDLGHHCAGSSVVLSDDDDDNTDSRAYTTNYSSDSRESMPASDSLDSASYAYRPSSSVQPAPLFGQAESLGFLSGSEPYHQRYCSFISEDLPLESDRMSGSLGGGDIRGVSLLDLRDVAVGELPKWTKKKVRRGFRRCGRMIRNTARRAVGKKVEHSDHLLPPSHTAADLTFC
ncbi:uncharacterized protein K452DRAFT_333879 [Aplosporella prunicola CBS 121167]|uniref:Uncharacterized protein n=1 Tax=Aplosporella prunicola CBS 121167 TaxID=1176127 RepID=A0A6A6BB31_9PEZI|nr:uncharacterized protein K452DRAFT_333879 [Aplosporella prunicola CBS 121167]KAF2141246.1 hypothetical protein K452DRAFT_333879 [Aplosporella prunicola CBS 121167]